MFETNNDVPSEGGQENPEDEEDVAYSWPILYYTPEGTLVVRRNFANELIVLNPFGRKINSRHNLSHLTKISYDTNPAHVDMASGMALFRIVFSYAEIEVYFSKDRDEIINHIVYCLRKLKREEAEALYNNQITSPDEHSEPKQPFNSYMQTLEQNYEHRPVSQSFTIDEGEDFSYQPSALVGYYEFQVFGVDSRGRFYPHILGLYSRFIRHYDEARRPFSQHNYTDINGEVQYFEQTSRLVIPYENDNLYTCIVSDKDRTILLLLLRGRNQIYQSLTDMDEKKVVDEENKLDVSDFPTKFTFVGSQGVTPSITGQEQYEEEQGGYGNVNSEDVNDPLRVIERGTKLMRHVKGLLGAGIQERYFMAKLVREPEPQVLVSWGKTKDKQNHVHTVVGTVTGDSARMFVSTSKVRPYQLQNYSFILMTARSGRFSAAQDIYVVAKDVEAYQAWTIGIKKLLQQKQNLLSHNTSMTTPTFARMTL